MKDLLIGSDKIINGRLMEGSYVQDESLTEIVIPEGVTDIGELAFYGCANLHRVTFPSTLRYIREEAFGESAIEEVILPEGMILIGEKAFFNCPDLRRADVPGPQTMIESDAFSCCDNLCEGYIGCGYPDNIRHHEELLYTLLWCSCPERHTPETSRRAAAFIHRYEDLVMDWIIKYNNIPAMSGLAGEDLLTGDINKYIIKSHQAGTGEITALLMTVNSRFDEGEFEL